MRKRRRRLVPPYPTLDPTLDVAFRYQAEREILRGVNLRIEPGTKLAVVGASGSGKSTLVKLLFRFHDASEGAILIDGQDIRDVTQQSLRAAYQDPLTEDDWSCVDVAPLALARDAQKSTRSLVPLGGANGPR